MPPSDRTPANRLARMLNFTQPHTNDPTPTKGAPRARQTIRSRMKSAQSHSIQGGDVQPLPITGDGLTHFDSRYHQWIKQDLLLEWWLPMAIACGAAFLSVLCMANVPLGPAIVGALMIGHLSFALNRHFDRKQRYAPVIGTLLLELAQFYNGVVNLRHVAD